RPKTTLRGGRGEHRHPPAHHHSLPGAPAGHPPPAPPPPRRWRHRSHDDVSGMFGNESIVKYPQPGSVRDLDQTRANRDRAVGAETYRYDPTVVRCLGSEHDIANQDI